MITEKEFLKAVDIIRRYRLQQSRSITTETSIYECGLDVRILNILSQVAIDYGIAGDSKGNLKVGDFEGFTKWDFAMYRRVGAKTIAALEKVFFEAGMEFKKIEHNLTKRKKKIQVQPSEIRSQFLN